MLVVRIPVQVIGCSAEYSGSALPTHNGYGMPCDVWSLGITVIEIAEGYPPHLTDKTPMQAMMAIARQSAPTLGGGSTGSWSKLSKSFVTKLLNKKPEHRPDIHKVLDMPFLTKIDEMSARGEMLDILRDLYPKREIDKEPVWSPVRSTNPLVERAPSRDESSPQTSGLIVYADVDNLSTLGEVSETTILSVLRHRFEVDKVFTNVGNILVACNPFKQVPSLAPGVEQNFMNATVRWPPIDAFVFTVHACKPLVTYLQRLLGVSSLPHSTH